MWSDEIIIYKLDFNGLVLLVLADYCIEHNTAWVQLIHNAAKLPNQVIAKANTYKN